MPADAPLTLSLRRFSALLAALRDGPLNRSDLLKGETDEAVKYYQRAVDMDGTWGKPLFKLGLAKLQKADTAGA